MLPVCPANLLVGSSGLEPPTSRLSGVRSNHLSYEPMSGRTRSGDLSSSPFLCSQTFTYAIPQPYGCSLPFVTAFRAAVGGDEQIRTVDPLLARQVLSQLSYTPMCAEARLSPSSSPLKVLRKVSVTVSGAGFHPSSFFPIGTLKIKQRLTFS